MGFNSWVTHALLASQVERNFRPSSQLGLGGRQTVFLEVEEIIEIGRQYGVPEVRLESLSSALDVDEDTLRTRGGVSDSVFIKTLLGMDTVSFDATAYENANEILDLNVPFSQQNASALLGELDAVYDGGCLDNVFDPAMAIKNLASLLKPGGRIVNWACASNWPGAYCMISPEWLLSFYAINGFQRIRTYVFVPQADGSAWPNLTAAVYRYSPSFSRSVEWDPWKAIQAHPGHPCFVLAVADSAGSKQPEEWLVPMQSHYLSKDLFDWRGEYEVVEDLPFSYSSSSPPIADLQSGPYGSDHFEFKGLIQGVSSRQ